MCNECPFTTNCTLILPYAIIIVLSWLEIQAPPAEVHVVLEAPSDVDKGKHNYVSMHSHLTTTAKTISNTKQLQVWFLSSFGKLQVLCIVTADCPTVRDCIMLQGLGKRTINIPQEIGSNYYQFGLHLLDDPNGTRVRNIEHDYREIEQINTEILREWVTGRGKKPMSWQTLIQVLRDIELGTLASEIEVIKLKPTS